MVTLETGQSSSPVSTANQHSMSFFPITHHMNLEVSCFNGSKLMDWIFKITQFFDYHAMSEHERLTIALFYMEGPVLAWFKWMARNGQLTFWTNLL